MKLIYGFYVFIGFSIIFTLFYLVYESIIDKENIDSGSKSFQQPSSELMCAIFKTNWYFTNSSHDIFTKIYNRTSCYLK